MYVIRAQTSAPCPTTLPKQPATLEQKRSLQTYKLQKSMWPAAAVPTTDSAILRLRFFGVFHCIAERELSKIKQMYHRKGGHLKLLIDMLCYVIFYFFEVRKTSGSRSPTKISRDLLMEECLKKIDNIWPIWLLDTFSTFTDMFFGLLWYIRHFQKPELMP